MRLRKRYMPLVALLGAALAVIPAMASSSSPPSIASLEINENCYIATWACWAPPGYNTSQQPPSTVPIAVGGELKFDDKTNFDADVIWMGSAPVCSGVPTSPSAQWEGECKFEQLGTYEFESPTLFKDASFNYRKYEVVVEAASTGTTGTGTGTTTTGTGTTTTGTGTTTTGTGTTTTGTGTTTTPTTTTPTTTTPTTPTTTPTTPSTTQPTTTSPAETGTGQSRTGGGSSPDLTGIPHDSLQGGSLHLPASQSSSVHGSVQVTLAGSRLEVDLLAPSSSIAVAGHSSGALVVGRLVKTKLPTGRFSFKIEPISRAQHSLVHRGHLSLTVKIILTPPHGVGLTRTLTVTLHR